MYSAILIEQASRPTRARTARKKRPPHHPPPLTQRGSRGGGSTAGAPAVMPDVSATPHPSPTTRHPPLNLAPTALPARHSQPRLPAAAPPPAPPPHRSSCSPCTGTDSPPAPPLSPAATASRSPAAAPRRS